MSMVGFPLLLIPLAIYNIVAFLMPGVSFDDPLVRLTLMSGAQWPITLADMLLALGVLLLLLEVIKGARGGKYLTDHSAVAQIRQFNLLPAGPAGNGRFHLGHCVAEAAPDTGGRFGLTACR